MVSRTGSVVVITYDGTDITSHCIFSSTSFESQFSAIPGMFELTLKDEAQTVGPLVTGKEVTLTIDGVLMFGGYVTQITRKFALPVDRTDAARGGVEAVKTRQWVLRGVDYNILFDKRVLRFSTVDVASGFLIQLPSFWNDQQAGEIIRENLPKYIDHDGFDLTSGVDDVDYIVPEDAGGVKPKHTRGAWNKQGTPWRKVMEDFSQFNGAVWYLTPQKKLLFKALEDVEAYWGFSDVPNHKPIGASEVQANGFKGATYGFRELDATEDGSNLINDALIWGGSEWAGAHGGTVFARRQNEDSIDRHHRWQLGETHFGEYGIQSQVNVRANTIVNGTRSRKGDQLYGFRNPQWQFRFTWFGHDVPLLNGVRNHLTPGQLVAITLYTFGTDVSHPLIQLLPLRQMRITFPELDPQGRGYAQFEGFFGIQPTDPWTLWRYLLKAKNKTARVQIAATTNTSERASFGSFGSFFPSEQPDGSRKTFSIFITVDNSSLPLGYIEGTTAVYVNGILQRNQVDYTESDPENGQITFYSAPQSSDWIWIQCRTMAG